MARLITLSSVSRSFRRIRQPAHDFIQQVTQAQHVGAGDADGLSQAQGIAFIQDVIQLVMVQLIGHQQHRLLGTAQNIGDLLILMGEPGSQRQ